MTANDRQSCLIYLNYLVDQYQNTYPHSINKKCINADYSALNEEIEINFKAPKFKVNDRVRITSATELLMFLLKVTLRISQEKYLLLILLLKLILGLIKLKT